MDEEQRLAAQRRMLAEKFGLRDSDEDDSGSEDATESSGRSVEEEENEGKHGKEANDVKADIGKNGVVSRGAAGDKSPETTKEPDVGPESDAPQWPGMLLSCPRSAVKLPAVYRYSSAEHVNAAARRECRITPITKYQSLYQESAGRRIAGAEKFIAYAVGGHVRVLGRGSQQNMLLKGHGSAVVDLEFARLTEGDESDGKKSEDGIWNAVAGSVGEDGSVFIWKLLRDDEPEEGEAEVGEDGVVQPVLEKVDVVKLEHPEKGRWYSRVMFRPVEGAVLSGTGMGVALMLLDSGRSEVRITELVKMGEKSKVLDRFVDGGHRSKTGQGIGAATWISKDLIATAKGGEVCITSIADPKNIRKLSSLDRDEASVVSSLNVLQSGKGFSILLVGADKGTRLEVWSLVDGKRPIIVQRLFVDGGSSDEELDEFNVVAHDSRVQDFIVVSSLRHKALFVLHYRRDLACFDAITQLPVRQAAMSLCVTKNIRRVVADNAKGIPEESQVAELGIWCVMPNSIHMMHVSATECAPKEDGSTVAVLEATVEESLQGSAATPPETASSKSVANGSVSSSANASKRAVPIAASTAVPITDESPVAASEEMVVPKQSSTGKAGAAPADPTSTSTTSTTTRHPAKALTLLKKPAPETSSNLPDGKSTESSTSVTVDFDEQGSSGVVATRSAQWEAKSKGGPLDTPGSPKSSGSTRQVTSASDRGSADSSGALAMGGASLSRAPASGVSGSGTSVTGTGAVGSSAASSLPPPLSADEIVAKVSAAAHQVAASLDEEGAKRKAVEMAKIPKLVAKVRQTADMAMEKSVTEALKKPMADAIIPVISEIVSQSSDALTSASAQAEALYSAKEGPQAAGSKMSSSWFAQSFRDARIASSFASACTKMEQQATDAVKRSMSSKYDALVKPSVDAVETATADLVSASHTFTENIQEEMAKSRALSQSRKSEDRKDAESEGTDVKEKIASFIAENDYVGAFSVALSSGEKEAVLELCNDLGVSEFFENETISQGLTLGLVRILGQNLEERTNTKLSWLRELLLVLEPSNDEIVAAAPPTLQQLTGNIEMLKRNKEVLNADPGLAKELKMLSLLIASLNG